MFLWRFPSHQAECAAPVRSFGTAGGPHTVFLLVPINITSARRFMLFNQGGDYTAHVARAREIGEPCSAASCGLPLEEDFRLRHAGPAFLAPPAPRSLALCGPSSC